MHGGFHEGAALAARRLGRGLLLRVGRAGRCGRFAVRRCGLSTWACARAVLACALRIAAAVPTATATTAVAAFVAASTFCSFTAFLAWLTGCTVFCRGFRGLRLGVGLSVFTVLERLIGMGRRPPGGLRCG